MSLRISSALTLSMVLAGCGAESPPPPGDMIDCAIGDKAELAADCTLEKVAGSTDFVIHHPDGGFRRFTHNPDTGVIAPVDGAAPLISQDSVGGPLYFAVEADRYRIPPDLLAAAPE